MKPPATAQAERLLLAPFFSRRCLLRFVACFLLATGIGLFWAAPPTRAETPPLLEFKELRIGFAGHYKLGCWTPLELVIAGSTWSEPAEVQVLVPDSDGVLTRVNSGPLQPFFSGVTTVRMFVRCGQATGDLIARVVQGDRVLLEQTWSPGQADGLPKPLPATAELLVCVGPEWDLAGSLPIKPDHLHFAYVESLATLPTQWQGYEGVDRLILLASEPGFFQGDEAAQRIVAIEDWVKLGGRLLISTSDKNAESLGPPGVAGSLIPASVSGVTELREASTIEAFAAASQRLASSTNSQPLRVIQLQAPRGRVEITAQQGGSKMPLVVRAAKGFGEITFLAFALNAPPISTWADRGLFYAKLLNLPATRAPDADENRYIVNTLGYNDLAGQLRSALFEFRNVRFVSFFVVGGLIFGYLLFIGPIDYLLVRHWIKRPELTWVTFPLTVLLVCLGAYYAAHALKGSELRLNQAEVIDFDLESGLVRGTVFSSLFSPASAPYDLTLETTLAASDSKAAASSIQQQPTGFSSTAPRILFSWLGLPGEALGGMDGQGAGAGLGNEQAYDLLTAESKLQALPIQVWSTKSLTARWQTQAPAPLEARLTEDLDRMLQGTITNRLGFDLTDARVFYDRWAYQLPRLPDGAAIRLGEDVQALTSKTLLNKQRIVASREVADAFDTHTKDVDRILEMMMFHQLAGGEQYTGGLMNRYQGFLDLSRQLDLSRAVLVAKVPVAGSKLLKDGAVLGSDADGRWVYYRFVLPVAAKPGQP